MSRTQPLIESQSSLPQNRVEAQVLRSPVDRLVSPLEQLANGSERLFSNSLECVQAGTHYRLPRYVFLGPEGGGTTIRVGLFAVIDGNEPQGAFALIRLASLLEHNPRLAQGYALYLYPVCNPTGFEDGTSHSRSGKDLIREFWLASNEPEVRLLESEIRNNAFDGIITLRGDANGNGISGASGSAVLEKEVLAPALKTAERFLQQSTNTGSDGEQRIITDAYQPLPRSDRPRAPFEITLKASSKAPIHIQVEALASAVQAVLGEYRRFISFGQNI